MTDGAYASMMRRIQSETVPSFLLLQYSEGWQVKNLSAIHHLFITPSVVEERKPLASTARRAGWIGCNILLSQIPPEGRIALIVDGQAMAKEDTRQRFAITERLASLSLKNRTWAATLLSLLHRIKKTDFTVDDVYKFEPELAMLFPKNSHIRAKLRQQLQVLRDAGFVSFVSRGVYRFNSASSDRRPNGH